MNCIYCSLKIPAIPFNQWGGSESYCPKCQVSYTIGNDGILAIRFDFAEYTLRIWPPQSGVAIFKNDIQIFYTQLRWITPQTAKHFVNRCLNLQAFI